MGKLETYASLVGRILLALIFLVSAFGKITGWSQTAQLMASKGFPLVPLFLFGAIVFELVGNLSLMLGFKAKIGAILLIIFLIPATLIFHNFWAYQGMEQQMQMIQFMKNISMLGGLLIVVSFGAGPLSIDSKKEKP